MTIVPLAIPPKRQGAGDGPLLAFIITSALLGPASIVLTFTMFGPAWGVLRVALPLIAVRGLGWGLQRFGKKPHSDGGDIDETSCSSACGCGAGDSDCSSGEGRSFWATLLSMICTEHFIAGDEVEEFLVDRCLALAVVVERQGAH